METAKKTHPMILVAAASVTAVSLAGVATLAGWFPASTAQTSASMAPLTATNITTPVATVAKADAPTTLSIPAGARITVEPKSENQVATKWAPRPAEQKVTTASRQDDTGYTRVSATPASSNGVYVENAQKPATQAVCHSCGTIQGIQETSTNAEGTGLGAVAGGVLGGLAGSQIGGGNGKKAMAVLGAVGGAFAGHEVEKRVRADKQYQITVRFDDGSTRTYTETQAPQWQSGDRVRLDNGRLILL